MVVEQKLGLCEACGRVFVLQYEYDPQAPVEATSEVHVLRRVKCPAASCGHTNVLLSPLHVCRLRVKSLLGPESAWNGAAPGLREERVESPFPVQ